MTVRMKGSNPVPWKHAERRYFKVIKNVQFGMTVIHVPRFGTDPVNRHKEIFDAYDAIWSNGSAVALFGTWEKKP